MTIHVLLKPERPTSIQIRVSPVAEAIAGLRFADACAFGRLAAGHGGVRPSGVVLHTTSNDAAPAPQQVRCVVVPRRQPRPPTRAATRVVRPAPAWPSGRGERPTIARSEWLRVREILDADLRYRMNHLAQSGIAGLFAQLHPRVRLRGAVVTVDTRCETESVIAADELVLMPSVQCDRVVLLHTAPERPPLLIYPARGVPRPGAGRVAPPRALSGVLDDASLPLLVDLDQPRTVDEIARRHDIKAHVARRRIATLESAGLLAACPPAKGSYQGTILARLLVSPVCEHCA